MPCNNDQYFHETKLKKTSFGIYLLFNIINLILINIINLKKYYGLHFP